MSQLAQIASVHSRATAPTDPDRSAPNQSTQGGLLRKLLLILVLGIVVYLVTRRGDSRR
ncbi:hypothetical protein ACFR9U_03160 [Halorientalis brevis]|uniref:Uncharacterized protein n=1 Tax=Halorientalis brevis TaxID=1126241 RepID=A0ABD6C9B2_9EURY